MAVRDTNYKWTQEANNLDTEVRLKLYPILNKAIENGMELEDIFYIVTNNVQDWMLDFVLMKQNEVTLKERAM